MSQEIIGGQAIVEGVMMLNGKKQGIAVRNPEDKIIIKKSKINPPNSKFAKLPFIRGIFQLIYMMIVGMKAINYSTSIALNEKEEDFSGIKVVLFILTSFIFAILLFKFLPLLAAKGITSLFPKLLNTNIIPNLIAGIIKISIFILYIYLMGLSKETRRIFEYHGAEHKTVKCRENKLPLTIKNVKKQSRFHPRCGTAFIMGVLIISILVYTIIPFNINFFANFGLRVLLLPVIMGISYEILRISGKNEKNIFFKIITAPGLWMQRMTTKEPNDKQIEVGIASLKAAF